MEVFTYIESLPAFVQGILGSAFFAFILFIGQKAILFTSSKLNKDKLVANSFALMAKETGSNDTRVRSYLTCLYGSIHYFLKGIIVLVLSYLSTEFNYIISLVGYFISIYFLFRSLSYVPHFDSLKDSIKDRKAQLDKLDLE